ncbi:PTS system mannose/fructose/sorbose family IID component [Serratia fonticola]|uniref:PTS system mannose/fructose/sorbose family IID component n=1 Tax=Serratia fonticola TaxID=47917 RepID=A0A4U9VC67_SERFO|nr:PTS system mannose/fructose/sorbose family IID component [Serratia fonticola]
MKMHMEFINVHPFDVTFLSGLVLAMEQNKEKSLHHSSGESGADGAVGEALAMRCSG